MPCVTSSSRPDNVVVASFCFGRYTTTRALWQWDYGIILTFDGLELPASYQVHFANSDSAAVAKIEIGDADGVEIPRAYLMTGLPVYAWVYLNTGSSDGETVYQITIPVQPRPKPEEFEPTPEEQSLIDQILAALNAAVEQTAEDVEAADLSAQEAAAQADRAETAQEAAEAAQTAAETAERNAALSATAAGESEAAARTYAQNAARSESNAEGYAEDALESANLADERSRAAADSAEEAEAAKNAVLNMGATATTLPEGSAATVTKSTDQQGAVTLAFGIPRGATGATGPQGDPGKGIASIVKTSTAGLVDTYTVTYSDGTTWAYQVTNGAKGDPGEGVAAGGTTGQMLVKATDTDYDTEWTNQPDLTNVAQQDDSYEALTAGNAEQLLSRKTTENAVPYKFRATPESADREYLDAVVGGTVAWNQLVQNGNFADGRTGWSFNNCTPSVSGNKVLVTVTSGTKAVNFGLATANKITQSGAHKYLFGFNLKVSDVSPGTAKYNVTGSTYPSVSLASGVDKRIEGIFSSNGGENRFFVYPFGTTSVTLTGDETIEAHDYIMIDLTQMFGSTIAEYIYSLETATPGAGVAWFRKLFPEDYYEYNPGELISVEGVSSHETVGFNAWDKSQIENGYVNDTNGATGGTSTSKNTGFVQVVGGMTYYIKTDATTGLWGAWYDAKKNYITGCLPRVASGYKVTAPQNAAYMRMTVVYNNNNGNPDTFCINLSDPTRNGEYEPYTKRSYPLDDSLTLRGIPKLDASNQLYYDGDTYESDGTVASKYNFLELDGSESWNLQSINSHGIANFYLTVPAYAIGEYAVNSVCNRFMRQNAVIADTTTEGYMFAGGTTLYIRLSSTKANTAETFKTWLSSNPTTFVYMLATPTTETADPFRNLQICDPDGTEEFVSTSLVPVGHVTRYPENLRAKIEGLPWNFNALIAMTETTTTASKAYAVGDYFILNNVLYRVASAIASGGTITPGTNAIATTIMDEIKSLA